MKRKNRNPSASSTPPDGKKKKVAGNTEASTAGKAIDFSSPQRVLESLLSSTNLDNFFEEHWEKKPLFVSRENADFYGQMFTKKDLEAILKEEEIQFIQDMSLTRYAEGKTELLNEVGPVNMKHLVEAAGVTVQFHQPDRYKDEVWRLVESLETYFTHLVGADAFIFQPGSQGLAPQFREMETFILQLEGKTKWKLFKPMQELPQEASPDLELSDVGEPTHEFDMKPGDLLYFPRGTIYFPAPIGDKDHTMYLALTTFQENSWGNLLNNALSKAVEKAMESDVEYRRGLPFNLSSFMGSGVHDQTETEDSSEQNGNQQKDEKEAEGEEAKPGNPKIEFNENFFKLLKGLVRPLNPDKAVADMLEDFYGCRLPPFRGGGKDVKKGQKESAAPSDESKIRLIHPDHVRVLIEDLSDVVAGDEDYSKAEEDDEEESEEEEEEEPEESEKGDKKGTNKSDNKAKQKPKKKDKEKDTKKKSKNDESDKEEDEEEMEEDEEEEDDYEESGDGGEGFGGEECILVLHSVKNDRSKHMMGDKSPCSILMFLIRYKEALRQITADREEYITVNSLQLSDKERLSLVTLLWEEGLLEME